MEIPALHAHVAHRFRGGAVPTGASVTYGVGFGGSPTPTDLAHTLHDLWVAELLELQGPSIALQETVVRLGPSPDGPSGSWVDDTEGGNTGGMVTPQVAILVRKRTATGGRKHRGRFYIPGLLEAGVDDGGSLTLETYNAWQAALLAFRLALVTFAVPMVVLHNDATDPTPVISLDLDVRVGTQRRRMRR